jgi:hypothetical protein
MASNDKDFKRELYTEINTDLSAFSKRFTAELRATTPIRTGQARGGWVNTYKAGSFGKQKIVPLARNQVPYIGVLDTGTSTQAPLGIVEPALKKTRKK